MKTELEEAAKKYANKKGDIPTTKLEDSIFKQGFIDGAKWQQEQEQNNENSWFNEYQEVENYIIKRIGDKFLEATPEKYNTASEATIALLEDNWEQNKKLYSEEEVRQMFSRYNEVISHRDVEEWQPWIDKQFKKNKWKK